MVSTSFSSNHLEIDVEKALHKSIDNPHYYVQYAHARINQLLTKNHPLFKKYIKNLDLLNLPDEIALIKQANNFKNVLEIVAIKHEVHRLPTYLFNLAKTFHSYYSNKNVHIADGSTKTAIGFSHQRLFLCAVIKNILAIGLQLMNITPMQSMEKI
jgi:arginyl-tRNA synthetase